MLKSLRDIGENEQITISYGDLPNTHLIQKYGFVLPENSNKKVSAHLPYREWQALLYEEEKLKVEISKKQRIPLTAGGVNCEFMNDRFSKETLRKLRLGFMTSKMLIDNGGSRFVEGKDFSE